MILLVLVLASRLVVGSLDEGRVDRHIEERGGELIRCEWKLFGSGWWKYGRDRSYRIFFRCHERRQRRGYVRLSRGSGVALVSASVIGDSRSRQCSVFPWKGGFLPEFESHKRSGW